MDQLYNQLTILLATWTADESEALFYVDNHQILNSYVGWIGLYVSKTNLICMMGESPSVPDTDGILTGHIGTVRFRPQPLTLA